MIRQINNEKKLQKQWSKNKMLYFWNKHTFPPLHCTEQHRETAGGSFLYIYHKRKALIPAFCVVGNCPTPLTVTEKKRNKEVEMFLIDHCIHQSLCELVTTE